MEKWTRLENPNFSDNEDTYETDTDNMCTDEPIDLKQMMCDPNQSQEDASSDWDTSKMVKTKAFRIKDILGLEENERIVATVPSKLPNTIDSNFSDLNKSLSTTPTTISMFYTRYDLISSEKKNKPFSLSTY